MDLSKQIEHGRELREQGKFDLSVAVLTRAVTEAGLKKKYLLMVTALGERCLVYKHYFWREKTQMFLVLATKDAEAMLEISLQVKKLRKLHTANFLLGEMAVQAGNHQAAVNHYQRSIHLFRGSAAEKGDWQAHLGEALFLSGQKKKGLAQIQRGIAQIKRSAKQVEPFLVHVWLSGIYMKLAKFLWQSDRISANKYLDEAREIIRFDRKLVLRKNQLRELEKELAFY